MTGGISNACAFRPSTMKSRRWTTVSTSDSCVGRNIRVSPEKWTPNLWGVLEAGYFAGYHCSRSTIYIICLFVYTVIFVVDMCSAVVLGEFHVECICVFVAFLLCCGHASFFSKTSNLSCSTCKRMLLLSVPLKAERNRPLNDG